MKKVIVSQQRFSHLTALYMLTSIHGQMQWFCQCDCGKFFIVAAAELYSGKTTSCGCSSSKSFQ